MADVEKVIKDLEYQINGHFKLNRETATDALELLKSQPQVVLCKDCKHYKNNKCFYTMRRHGLHDDWFCADGERRTD